LTGLEHDGMEYALVEIVNSLAKDRTLGGNVTVRIRSDSSLPAGSGVTTKRDAT
jgi:hypothetical protein